MRLLGESFGKDVADPAALTNRHFDRTLQIARERFDSNLYLKQVRTRLVEIAELVRAYGLSRLTLKWKIPMVDLEDNRKGQPALDFEQLSALAQISAREDLSMADRLKCCVTDLCMCAGFRIEEVLTLPVDTHVTQAALNTDGTPIVDATGRPVVHHGLRYWAGKGESRSVMVKPIPSAMLPVMFRALDRARSLTAGPRAVARHQAEHARTILGAPWDDMSDDKLLSAVDIEQAVGLKAGRDKGAAGFLFVRNNKIPDVEHREPGEHSYTSIYVRKIDLYDRLYEMSDHGDMREREVDEVVGLEDLLFVVHKGLDLNSHGIKGTSRLLRYAGIVNYLCGSSNSRSIFTRLGLLKEGRPISVSSHQFRVTLNNMAQSLGVGQIEIARWMGRMTLDVNAAYDKREPTEKASKLRAGLEQGGAYALNEPIVHLPLEASEQAIDETMAAHVSGVGVCHHDFASPPCPAHGALVQAGFLESWNGDPEQVAEVLRQTEELLAASEKAEAEAVFGAADWAVAHRQAVLALRGHSRNHRKAHRCP